MNTALNLSVGEKERGTFEPLLSTGARRTALITGKLLATTSMGVLNGFFTVFGFAIFSIISAHSFTFNFEQIFALVLITALISLFFSAINFTFGTYARSTKEAQTYVTPLSLIIMIPSFFSLSGEVSNISFAKLSIPILNITYIIKEILAKNINYSHLLIVSLWIFFYSGLIFEIIRRMFKKESVIFRI